MTKIDRRFIQKYQIFGNLSCIFRKRLPTRKYLWFLIIAYIGYQCAQFIFNDSFSSIQFQRAVKPEVLNVEPDVPNHQLQNEPEALAEQKGKPEVRDIFEQIKIETNLEKLQELNKEIQVSKSVQLVRFEPLIFILRLV